MKIEIDLGKTCKELGKIATAIGVFVMVVGLTAGTVQIVIPSIVLTCIGLDMVVENQITRSLLFATMWLATVVGVIYNVSGMLGMAILGCILLITDCGVVPYVKMKKAQKLGEENEQS